MKTVTDNKYSEINDSKRRINGIVILSFFLMACIIVCTFQIRLKGDHSYDHQLETVDTLLRMGRLHMGGDDILKGLPVDDQDGDGFRDQYVIAILDKEQRSMTTKLLSTTDAHFEKILLETPFSYTTTVDESVCIGLRVSAEEIRDGSYTVEAIYAPVFANSKEALFKHKPKKLEHPMTITFLNRFSSIGFKEIISPSEKGDDLYMPMNVNCMYTLEGEIVSN